LLSLLTGSAWAQSTEAPVEVPEVTGDEDLLSPHRLRFDVLVDRTIGTASTPVAFNWRRTQVQVAATGSFLVELNAFNSMRAGAMVRLPSERTLVEVGLSWAEVWDSSSSQLLALTPYRQAGRPDRLELDVNLALPLAEGVVTSAPRLFPAVQLVFNGYVGVRYGLYPTGWAGMTPGEVVGAIFNPALTKIELDNLQDARLDAMEVDPHRYGFMVGLGNDIYFEQGLFISPRIMMSLPLLAPATGTSLVIHADASMVIGVAF
jgi:hypothetical protein